MTKEVTITTESPEKVKPLLETAIQSELKSPERGIACTRERLTAFEKQFG